MTSECPRVPVLQMAHGQCGTERSSPCPRPLLLPSPFLLFCSPLFPLISCCCHATIKLFYLLELWPFLLHRMWDLALQSTNDLILFFSFISIPDAQPFHTHTHTRKQPLAYLGMPMVFTLSTQLDTSAVGYLTDLKLIGKP